MSALKAIVHLIAPKGIDLHPTLYIVRDGRGKVVSWR